MDPQGSLLILLDFLLCSSIHHRVGTSPVSAIKINRQTTGMLHHQACGLVLSFVEWHLPGCGLGRESAPAATSPRVSILRLRLPASILQMRYHPAPMLRWALRQEPHRGAGPEGTFAAAISQLWAHKLTFGNGQL